MNIHTVLKYARKYDCAIKRKTWGPGVFVQHGMDNVLRFTDGRMCPLAISELLAADWIITGEGKYQPCANDSVRGGAVAPYPGRSVGQEVKP